jgi:hypothetical protein
MKLLFASLALVSMLGVTGLSAEQTWTGVISDSNCGAVHRADVEHGGRITARECIIGRESDPNIPGCVSARYGRQFVFVVGETVFKVSNQDFAGLRTHAAHRVKLTGELAGDTIKVSKIEMAGN